MYWKHNRREHYYTTYRHFGSVTSVSSTVHAKGSRNFMLLRASLIQQTSYYGGKWARPGPDFQAHELNPGLNFRPEK